MLFSKQAGFEKGFFDSIEVFEVFESIFGSPRENLGGQTKKVNIVSYIPLKDGKQVCDVSKDDL
jgi:hypothetical protein